MGYKNKLDRFNIVSFIIFSLKINWLKMKKQYKHTFKK